jgi:predicted transposase YbfD/YdcC
LERVRWVKGAEHRETVFAITSSTREQAPAARLLEVAPGHRGIENRLHWVKDVLLGEDACRVRTGRGPQIRAGLRNAALRLLHTNRLNRSASALRHLAAFPMKSVQLVTQGRIVNL